MRKSFFFSSLPPLSFHSSVVTECPDVAFSSARFLVCFGRVFCRAEVVFGLVLSQCQSLGTRSHAIAFSGADVELLFAELNTGFRHIFPSSNRPSP